MSQAPQKFCTVDQDIPVELPWASSGHPLSRRTRRSVNPHRSAKDLLRVEARLEVYNLLDNIQKEKRLLVPLLRFVDRFHLLADGGGGFAAFEFETNFSSTFAGAAADIGVVWPLAIFHPSFVFVQT